MPQPQIWPRRQKVQQQQVSVGSAPIEEVERTNVRMVCPNQRAGFAQHNLYTMDMDYKNQNCYNYRRFGHLARNYRNRRTENRIGEEKRLEYRERRENKQDRNLNGDKNLIVLN